MAAKKEEREVRLKDGSVYVITEGDDEVDFAQALRDAIKKSGLTQYKLAQVSGIPQGAISNFLSGKDLRLSTFTKLAKLMGFEMKQNRSKMPKKK